MEFFIDWIYGNMERKITLLIALNAVLIILSSVLLAKGFWSETDSAPSYQEGLSVSNTSQVFDAPKDDEPLALATKLENAQTKASVEPIIVNTPEVDSSRASSTVIGTPTQAGSEPIVEMENAVETENAVALDQVVQPDPEYIAELESNALSYVKAQQDSGLKMQRLLQSNERLLK